QEARSRRLDDIGDNAPNCWEWGRPDRAECMPDVIVLLYAEHDKLGPWELGLQDDLWRAAFSTVKPVGTDHIGNREPIGFADSLSRAWIDGDRRPDRLRDTRDYTNMSSPGEFLLGYENEYRRYTDRPLLFPRQDPDGLLPSAKGAPEKRDFGRNGSYLVV